MRNPDSATNMAVKAVSHSQYTKYRNNYLKGQLKAKCSYGNEINRGDVRENHDTREQGLTDRRF